MTAKISFGQWLRQRRKTLDTTREELAQQVGCAINTLYKIEADERRPSKQMAALLAEHLNIPPAERDAFVRFARGEGVESAVLWGTPFHPPHNLSVPPSPLIGREEDVIAIRKRLLQTESRLLTLIGPPGIGKTRLSQQVAAQILEDFADGVFFVALASITDSNLVSMTIANILGVPNVGPQTPLERLQTYLRDKEMLLILDNFEQILAAALPIAELLSACASLKLLVTSRSPLRIRHERQFPVSALALPDLSYEPNLESVSNSAAVTLFLERAQMVEPDFSLTPENSLVVAAICIRLDGLPLAIELISARVKLLPPSELLKRLHGRLLLQSDGLRDIEPRHRTLNAAIDWSYQLLSADEQILFRRLGVFVGGWTLNAAENICTENLNLNIVDGVASLLDKNLVKRDTRESRFTMLETIRQYALAQLASSGELEDLRNRHADYFTTFAEHTDSLFFHADPVRWMNLLDAELDNFREVLAWSKNALQLAVALREFWQRRGYLVEGIDWLERGLKRKEIDRALRANALQWLGWFHVWQDNLDTPLSRYEESLTLYQELEDKTGIAYILGRLGSLYQMRGDHERARAFLDESLALFRKLENDHGATWIFLLLGWLSYVPGDLQQANLFWQESLNLFRAVNDPWGISSVSMNVAKVALDMGDYDRARDHLTESITLHQKLGERWQIIHVLEMFGCLLAAQGQQTPNPQPNGIRAGRILGAVEKFQKTFGPQSQIYRSPTFEQIVATLHTQLDPALLAAAWAEGRKMSLEQAIAYALEHEPL